MNIASQYGVVDDDMESVEYSYMLPAIVPLYIYSIECTWANHWKWNALPISVAVCFDDALHNQRPRFRGAGYQEQIPFLRDSSSIYIYWMCCKNGQALQNG